MWSLLFVGVSFGVDVSHRARLRPRVVRSVVGRASSEVVGSLTAGGSEVSSPSLDVGDSSAGDVEDTSPALDEGALSAGDVEGTSPAGDAEGTSLAGDAEGMSPAGDAEGTSPSGVAEGMSPAGAVECSSLELDRDVPTGGSKVVPITGAGWAFEALSRGGGGTGLGSGKVTSGDAACSCSIPWISDNVDRGKHDDLPRHSSLSWVESGSVR